MSERGIMASFGSPEEALSCISKLQALRATDLQVDHGHLQLSGAVSESAYEQALRVIREAGGSMQGQMG
ncbi:hypothetical protein [Paenibacillus puerhi]|uniref:hypothetical protein n=1 Tax=Paenibacillus puerhi TaxID=2692622 RepID=UPI0013584B6B|nr:hypothetical protein [Paenibacillus puerhi]